MYGCVLFMEDEAWDVYVSTPVYIKSKMYVITHRYE